MFSGLVMNFAAACANKGIPILPTWYKYLDSTTDSGGRCTPTFNITEPRGLDLLRVLLAIFEIILRVGGFMAVIFVMYGGFLYLTSGGEPEKTRNGRSTIINALVGLAVTVSATAIVNIIGRAIV